MNKVLVGVILLVFLGSCSKEEQVGTLDAPVALLATDVWETAFTANWENVPLAERYTIQVATDKNFDSLAQTVNTWGSIEIGNLEQNTLYYYRVQATSSNLNRSAFSNSIEVFTLPQAPVVESPISITTDGFTCIWNSVSGIDTYLVYVSEGIRSYGPVFILPQYNGFEVSTPGIQVAGLESGKTYFFLVRSKSANGAVSEYSSYKEIATL